MSSAATVTRSESPVFVGLDGEATGELAEALGTDEVVTPPDLGARSEWVWGWADDLASWDETLGEGVRCASAVVCAWPESSSPGPIHDLSSQEWLQRVELPLSLWFSAVRTVTERCADGGAVAVVAERPAALDASGHADLVTLAEGLAALTRSLALVHGQRGVRINLVVTELFTSPEVPLGLTPALPSSPGTAGREVAGAVQMLLSPSASGVTGTVVRADCGRSW